MNKIEEKLTALIAVVELTKDKVGLETLKEVKSLFEERGKVIEGKLSIIQRYCSPPNPKSNEGKINELVGDLIDYLKQKA